MEKINLNQIEVNTYTVRRYGKSFFAYGAVKYKGQTFDAGDPFPSAKFPKYEGIVIALQKIEGTKIVSETEFRQLFKGLKDGAQKYAAYAENLETHHKVEFI